MNTVLVEQLAVAYEAVARLDHYMVGVVAPYTDEELDAAEQVLIEKQNAGPQRGARYNVLERALDLIEDSRAKRRRLK
jgi:hypothetical protein